jgi:murein DD-endopeptidase MepM/ murein hydrolase activator NlpD
VGGFEPMSDCVALVVRRSASFALTGIVGIWLSGCADATRFADNGSPFSNPFSTASNDAPASPTPRVSSRQLPPSGGYATSARPSPSGVAATRTPAPESTGSIHARPEAVGGSSTGWTAVGGSPIVVGSSDDAASLSARYGVPQAALLSANGLRSASEVHNGMRIVVPVYNVHGEARVAKADEEPKPRHSAEAEDDAKPRHASRKDDEDAKPVRKAKADDDEDEKPRHKAKGKSDADADDDSPKAKKARKAEAEADDSQHAKSAKADDAKAEKAARKLAKAEAAKDADKPAASAPQVAKADPPKPKIDRTPTADISTPASAASAEAESGEFRWPARGRIIQGFKQGGNDGINIALPEGTSVRAAEDGKVAYAGNALKGYGNLVLIRHPNGFVTAYANNGELDVKVGDVVKRGQVIAKSGQTGDVSTPQLHFEVRKGQTPVDPTTHLAGL